MGSGVGGGHGNLWVWQKRNRLKSQEDLEPKKKILGASPMKNRPEGRFLIFLPTAHRFQTAVCFRQTGLGA
jgi:hypothetical protein